MGFTRWVVEWHASRMVSKLHMFHKTSVGKSVKAQHLQGFLAKEMMDHRDTGVSPATLDHTEESFVENESEVRSGDRWIENQSPNLLNQAWTPYLEELDSVVLVFRSCCSLLDSEKNKLCQVVIWLPSCCPLVLEDSKVHGKIVSCWSPLLPMLQLTFSFQARRSSRLEK